MADIYERADTVVRELSALGYEHWSSKISNSIADGTTGTEIFMGLRKTLASLRRARLNIPQSLARDVKALHGDIKMALWRATLGM